MIKNDLEVEAYLDTAPYRTILGWSIAIIGVLVVIIFVFWFTERNQKAITTSAGGSSSNSSAIGLSVYGQPINNSSTQSASSTAVNQPAYSVQSGNSPQSNTAINPTSQSSLQP